MVACGACGGVLETIALGGLGFVATLWSWLRLRVRFRA